jgi:hypothetical protein
MTDVADERNEDEVLARDFSDEALENAAATGAAAYTMGFCTGLAACPGS